MWTTLGYECLKQKRELIEHRGDAQGTGCQVVKNLHARLLVLSVDTYTKESNLMRPYIFKIVTISYQNGTYSFFHLCHFCWITCYKVLFNFILFSYKIPVIATVPMFSFSKIYLVLTYISFCIITRIYISIYKAISHESFISSLDSTMNTHFVDEMSSQTW